MKIIYFIMAIITASMYVMLHTEYHTISVICKAMTVLFFMAIPIEYSVSKDPKNKYLPLVIIALFLSCAGDVLLEIDGMFIIGMAAFLIANSLYLSASIYDSPKSKNYWVMTGSFSAIMWIILVIVLSAVNQLGIQYILYVTVLSAVFGSALVSMILDFKPNKLLFMIAVSSFIISDILVILGVSGINLPYAVALNAIFYFGAQFLYALSTI